MKLKLFRPFILLIYSFSILILLIVKPEIYSFMDKGLITIFIVLYLFALFVHFSFNDKTNWLRLDVFFILGFTIVHFQWPIMYVLSGIIPENYWRIFVDDKVANYSTWLSTIGGLTFLTGFHLMKMKRRKKHILPPYNYKNILLFTAVTFIIFLLFAGKGFFSGGIYKGEGDSIAGEGLAKYFGILFQIGLIVSTALIIYTHKHSYKGNLFKWFISLNRLYLITIVFYITIFLLIGDRGGPLSLILLILVLVGNQVRKFKFREVLIITIFGGFLMTIIGLGRNEASGLDILSAGTDKITDFKAYDATLELANSIRTLNTAVDHIPRESDYFYGTLWAGNILSTIPFAQSQFLKLTGLDAYKLGSANYITYLVYGKDSPSGEGTSLIADIYLNFGWFGVMVLMFFFGMLIKRLSIEIRYPTNINWFIAGAVIAGFTLYYARTGLFMPMRNVVWGILVFNLLVKPLKNYRKV